MHNFCLYKKKGYNTIIMGFPIEMSRSLVEVEDLKIQKKMHCKAIKGTNVNRCIDVIEFE